MSRRAHRLASSPRHSFLGFAALALLLLGAACGGTTQATGATGAPGTGDDDAGATQDAAPGASDAGGPKLPLPDGAFTPPAEATLPFEQPVEVSTGSDFDYDGTLLEDAPSGRWIVLFERFHSDTALDAELRASWLDGATFAPSVLLPLTGDTLEAGPSAFVQGGATFVYFMHGDAAKKKARLARAAFHDGAFDAAEDLSLADTFTGMLAWPSAVEASGDVVLAYDHYGIDNHVARGDGARFGAPTTLGHGVQGRVGSFADGALVFTYQNGDPTNMIAYVRVSSDGASWSDPSPITTKVNVHDVSSLRRADGGVDVYYISSDSASGFRIYRRSVRKDATLGAEELVSADAAGSLTQPHPTRLRDGSIGLVFARQVTSNTDTDTCVAHLRGDAPP